MNDRIRVLILTSALGSGGAEQHVVRILKHLSRERLEISLALARGDGPFLQRLPHDIPVTIFGKNHVRSVFRDLRSLIRAQRPDVLLAVQDHANVLALLATKIIPIRGASPQVVVNVQNTVSVFYRNSRLLRGRILPWLIRLTYPYADGIVAISHGVANDLLSLTPTVAGRTHVIYNAGCDDEILHLRREPVGDLDNARPLILGCGRLAKEKGFSYLLEAFAQINKDLPARLVILGEGGERKRLESLATTLGIGQGIRLIGFRLNPYKYMSRADVFVLSSLWEGFGNVIVEAMVCGAPVIATDCRSGPGEIITHRVNGLLVPPGDSEALARAILQVLEDKALATSLKEAGYKRAKDFHASTIARQYERLFSEIVSDTHGV